MHHVTHSNRMGWFFRSNIPTRLLSSTCVQCDKNIDEKGSLLSEVVSLFGGMIRVQNFANDSLEIEQPFCLRSYNSHHQNLHIKGTRSKCLVPQGTTFANPLILAKKVAMKLLNHFRPSSSFWYPFKKHTVNDPFSQKNF